MRGLEGNPPTSLSKGQRLRVALAAVLILDPQILLLDEPTTGQNEENIFSMMRVIGEFDNLQLVIFCSHDIDTVLAYANRVIVLKQGTVVADGIPDRVLTDDKLLSSCSITIPFPHAVAKYMGIDCDKVPTFEELVVFGKT